MSDLCLLDFEEKGEDDFSNLKFESDVIKAVDFEGDNNGEELFEYSKELTTQRVPKKKGLEFAVITTTCYCEERSWDCGDVQTFKKEQDARDCFEGLKSEMEWFRLKNKEGKVFDGRRYMWKVKDGKLTGEKGWD